MELNKVIPCLSCLIFVLTLSSGTTLRADQKNAVATAKGSHFSIDWNYEKFPLKIDMYELKNPGKIRPQSMGRLKSKINDILANRIAGNSMFVPNQDIYKFALAVENTTKKHVSFYVVPHEITPAEYSLGTKFACLCVGHVYSVAPGEIWYRVVSLQNLTPALGNDFKIRHRVVGIDAASVFKDAKEFQESE